MGAYCVSERTFCSARQRKSIGRAGDSVAHMIDRISWSTRSLSEQIYSLYLCFGMRIFESSSSFVSLLILKEYDLRIDAHCDWISNVACSQGSYILCFVFPGCESTPVVPMPIVGHIRASWLFAVLFVAPWPYGNHADFINVATDTSLPRRPAQPILQASH